MYISVLTSISNINIDKTFTYHVPNKYIDLIKKGIRVLIPFNNQVLEGFVIDINIDIKDINYEIKDIIDVIDTDVILTDELMDLGKKMKDMYLCTLISCYQTMLPKGLKANKNNKNIVNKKFEKYVKLIDYNYQGTLKQQELINKLKEHDLKLKDANDISISVVKTLIKNNVIETYEQEVFRKEYDNINIIKNDLTIKQQEVYDLIKNSKDKIYLLHGVTGSGKTEIYMKLIDDVINNDKTAIMLVPEISLTEQITNRFLERFGKNIAVLHSRLSDGERYDEYRRIKNGEVKIVIGTRSAVFAPLTNIGYIIIDEEHSNSFKQDNNPKYHALDIAKLRLNYHNDLKIILGTATPSLDSFARSTKNLYKLIDLPVRVNNINLPKVEIIDMNTEIKKNRNYFSNKLIMEMNKTFDNNEQVILFLNRRGYASFITCKNCGYVEKCPNCDITLTYHKTSNTLRCHYCGFGDKVKDICPSCHEKSISNLGIGTEKIEEELSKLFPDKKVLRMDLDTTSKKNSHKKMIEAFKNHEYDILLGTQIVAKGLDFPLVTLVGVINADTSLNIPNFRSSEETYQLLSQVAGRSGRSKKEGRVIIQTFNKDHYVFKYVKEHNYLGYYNEEMNIRKKLNYPPYYFLVSIKVMSSNYDNVKNISNEIGIILRKKLNNSIILGPSVASIFRVNNIYRFQLIIKYKKEDNLYKVLSDIKEHYRKNLDIKIDIDFNPNFI